MWRMPSAEPLAPVRTSLVQVYIDALCGRAIYVHGGLKDRAAHFGFVDRLSIMDRTRKFSLVTEFWFARPAHAELVGLRCYEDFKDLGAMRRHGWVGMPPEEVVEKVKTTAGMLGAKWQTQSQIEHDAEKVVAEVIASVEAARQNGGLKQVNLDYKKYRKAQIEKREPAVPYTVYLGEFTRLLVLRAAQKNDDIAGRRKQDDGTIDKL
jgi:hypothetical protein